MVGIDKPVAFSASKLPCSKDTTKSLLYSLAPLYFSYLYSIIPLP